MTDELKADFQAVADKNHQAFSITIETPEVPEVPEVPAIPAVPMVPAASETVVFVPLN